MDEHTISPAGDPFHAAPHDQDERSHACNNGWVTLGQILVDPETGEVTCLDVQGGFARLSGPITEARGGSTLTVGTQTFEPRSFVITAFDSGNSVRRQIPLASYSPLSRLRT